MTPYTWSAVRYGFSQMVLLPGYLSVGNICGRVYNNASVGATVLQALGPGKSSFDASSKELYGIDPDASKDWNVPLLPVSLWDRVLVARNTLRIMTSVRKSVKSIDPFLSSNPAWCKAQLRKLPLAPFRDLGPAVAGIPRPGCSAHPPGHPPLRTRLFLPDGRRDDLARSLSPPDRLVRAPDRRAPGLRGLLFIALEQLVVDVASAGRIYPLEFSILSGLGAVMIFGILFLRLSGPGLATAGTAIVLIMQFLPGLLLDAGLGIFTPIRLLLVPGSVGAAFVLYAPIPWLGGALLGMAFARLLLQDQDKAYRVAAVSGLVCLALFPIVRTLGGLGNLRMPPGDALIDYFNLVKYPPSLSFLLLALGFDLVALYLISRASAILVTWGRPVVILGQAALYFFLVHWFIYGAMGLVWSEPGGLPKTYLAWAIGLILLYPVCKTYEAFKHSMPANSVWRML